MARVAEEVTRQLSPPDTGRQPLAVPSALSEVPLGSVPLVQSTSDQADAAVQSLISAAQSALSGELQVVHSAQPSQMFISPSLPVDARVSDKVKAKIWNNEFFEFSLLLSNPVQDNSYKVTVSNFDREQLPSLCLVPANKAKRNLSIEAWISCFHIFVGVYTSRYPHEAPALMKYGEVVQDLAARGFNWRFYDENFRFLRQAHAACFVPMAKYSLGIMDACSIPC